MDQTNNPNHVPLGNRTSRDSSNLMEDLRPIPPLNINKNKIQLPYYEGDKESQYNKSIPMDIDVHESNKYQINSPLEV